MSTELAKAPETKVSLLQMLSSAVGLEPLKYYAAIKRSCGCEGATDEDFSVLMMASQKYNLNAMLRQLYLMKTKRGIQVVIPVDGWVPLLVNHDDYLAHDVVLQWEGEPFVSKCVAATCRIWTQTRSAMNLGPFEHTEMMEECWCDTGPWKSHPTRMLGHKAVIQGTRRAFGIYVMDSDEASRIDGTPSTEPKPVALTFKGTQTLPEPETVEAEPTELNAVNDCSQQLERRIVLCNSGKEAAAIAMDIGAALADGRIDQGTADELSADLKEQMA